MPDHTKLHSADHTNGTDDIQDASATVKGLMTNASQTIGGNKTFDDGIQAQQGDGTAGTSAIKLKSGTLLSSPEAGAVEYDGDRFYATEHNTTRRVISVASDVKVADTTIANTTTETSIIDGGGTPFDALTIQAEAQAGKMYRIPFFGKISTSVTAVDITFKVRLGGTTELITLTASPSNITDQPFHGEVTFIIRTVGAGGTYCAFMTLDVDDTLYDSTPVTGSIDTTSSQELDVTVTWEIASADNTLTCQGLVLEDMN